MKVTNDARTTAILVLSVASAVIAVQLVAQNPKSVVTSTADQANATRMVASATQEVARSNQAIANAIQELAGAVRDLKSEMSAARQDRQREMQQQGMAAPEDGNRYRPINLSGEGEEEPAEPGFEGGEDEPVLDAEEAPEEQAPAQEGIFELDR